MATVGTEDSNLLFQFNTPVNKPSLYFQESKKLSEQRVTFPQDDIEPLDFLHTNDQSTLIGNGMSFDQNDNHTLFSVPGPCQPKSSSGSTKSSISEGLRRLNPTNYHLSTNTNSILKDAKIYSQYNNYLNEKFSHSPRNGKAQREEDPQILLERKMKLEELVNKFWLKDGQIDESIFEDSSDEENL